MLAIMSFSSLPLILLVYVVPIAIAFLVLYAVVRAAVLSALRAHERERQAGHP